MIKKYSVSMATSVIYHQRMIRSCFLMSKNICMLECFHTGRSYHMSRYCAFYFIFKMCISKHRGMSVKGAIYHSSYATNTKIMSNIIYDIICNYITIILLCVWINTNMSMIVADDSLTYHHGQSFSTKDRDNDLKDGHCAQEYKGGWWYVICHHSNLNGLYLRGHHDSDADGIEWSSWHGQHYSLKKVEMKLRPLT